MIAIEQAAAEKALRDRGIGNANELAALASPDAILGACRWFDAQRGRVGPGVLVNEVRAGGKPGWQPTPAPGEYGRSIVRWLDEHFPDLEQHPAAIAAVARLHYRYGKGSLTVGEHGPRIRAAVDRWEAKLHA